MHNNIKYQMLPYGYKVLGVCNPPTVQLASLDGERVTLSGICNKIEYKDITVRKRYGSYIVRLAYCSFSYSDINVTVIALDKYRHYFSISLTDKIQITVSGIWKQKAYELSKADVVINGFVEGQKYYPIFLRTPKNASLLFKSVAECSHDIHAPNFFSAAKAVQELHWPTSKTQALLAQYYQQAIDSLALDYTLDCIRNYQLQLSLTINKALTYPLSFYADVLRDSVACLPYVLTPGQQKGIQDMKTDLEASKWFVRLIQGDVGSGKSVIMFLYIIQFLSNKLSTIVIAPTTLLAYQHFANFSRLYPHFKALYVHAKSCLKSDKEPCVIFTTHLALCRQPLTQHSTGLVIVDEQQKFGAEQRNSLLLNYRKGSYYPNLLMMTATPIPRTLLQSYSSHMAVTSIQDKPAGRIPISTIVVTQNRHEAFYTFIIRQLSLDKGMKIFWVVPKIVNIKQRISQVTTKFNIQYHILHGRMDDKEKIDIVNAFFSDSTQILFTTSVIETGIDCNHINTMIIDDPQFSLAQIHQLRGRVGRGREKAFCYIMTYSDNQTERIKILAYTNDGATISLYDLAARGTGDLVGSEQSGYAQNAVVKKSNILKVLSVVQSITKI